MDGGTMLIFSWTGYECDPAENIVLKPNYTVPNTRVTYCLRRVEHLQKAKKNSCFDEIHDPPPESRSEVGSEIGEDKL